MGASEPDLCFGVACDCRGLLSVPVSPSALVFPRGFPVFVNGQLDLLRDELSFASAHMETLIPRAEPTILYSFQMSQIQDSCAA